ncbi:hypothetical protein [Moorena sp. SIO3I6]|uniref:hypothetical protein n=1 Tax=Moorena sp. SIO3I6 TaxID=2607831 RepID=UPI0013BF9928|nr:hypothetical protein [Moorena sp. SIO3I6]NEO09344.1 hypothetical protein [Moorena sp. SIO3I8]
MQLCLYSNTGNRPETLPTWVILLWLRNWQGIAEVRSQKSEVRSQWSAVSSQRSAVGQ